MRKRVSRRQALQVGAINIIGLGLGGCGTILYPERRGQVSGPLDWKVVALDAVGLLFFFVPGIVAFAVDFSTGAIYLPASELAESGDRRELVAVQVPAEELTLPRTDVHGWLMLRTLGSGDHDAA